MGKFEIKNTKTGIKFNLKAGNGEIIATSEVYTTEAACRKGIESVKNNALSAVEDLHAQILPCRLRPAPNCRTGTG